MFYHCHFPFVLAIIHFNYLISFVSLVSFLTGGNPTWLLGFGLEEAVFFSFFLSDLDCFSAHLRPPWLSSYGSWKQRNEGWRKTTSKQNLFINNREWEQRVNVSNAQQEAALATVGGKNFGAQKSCNAVSVNYKQHSDVCLSSQSVRFTPKSQKV